MVCRICTHDAHDQRPGADSASRKCCDLSRIAGVDGSGDGGRDVRLDSVEDGEGGHLRMVSVFRTGELGE